MKKVSKPQMADSVVAPDRATADPAQFEPLVVSYNKAALALDVSTKTISRLVKRGEVEAIKIGTKNAILYPSLKRYVARLAA